MKKKLKKELETLAKDFGIFSDEVKVMIETSTEYNTAQKKILSIYDRTYMRYGEKTKLPNFSDGHICGCEVYSA